MCAYSPADWGDVDDVVNSRNQPLYKHVKLDWSEPTTWQKEDGSPTFDTEEPFVYALLRNHGNSHLRNGIEYIGLTKSPNKRFYNHPTAKEIVSKNGEVTFTYAPIRFVSGRKTIRKIGIALEEIEHLLIWATYSLNHELTNDRKQNTLPGMGTNGGHAWKITNSGYRFGGRMPREIVYPWMLIVPGRNRSFRHM